MDKDSIIKALENAPLKGTMNDMAPLVYGYIVNATLFYDEVIKIEPHIFIIYLMDVKMIRLFTIRFMRPL